MSEVQARPGLPRDLTVIAGGAVGVLAFGVLLAGLLRPEFGRYASEAVALVCALGTAGIALFAAVVPSQRDLVPALRVLSTRLAVTAFAAVLVTLPFAVMDVSGDGLRGLGNSLARAAALRSGDYETVVARGTGLVLIVGAVHKRRPPRLLLLTGAVLVTGSFLLMGHVRTHGPQAAVLATTFAHVFAAAAWFGGLLALGVTLRRSRDDAMQSGLLLAAFARLMTAVLATLLAAGVGLAILYLPSPAALIHTAYGEVLLVKLAVVATTLVLSSANHLKLVPVAQTGNMHAVRVLRSNIAAEQALLVTVLVITEVLMRQNPAG